MATITVPQGSVVSLSSGNIFQLTQPGGGTADTVALHIELNGAASLTATTKAAGTGSGWTPLASLVYPRSTNTGTSTVIASDVYMMDGTGVDLFLDVTAMGAGGPARAWWGYGAG